MRSKILSRVAQAGYPSLLSFCKKHRIAYQSASAILCLRNPALGRHGWTKAAIELATALGVEPEELFDEQEESDVVSLSAPEASFLISDQSSPEEEIGRKLAVAKFLAECSQRQRHIIEEMYGLSGDAPATLDDLAVQHKCSKSRISQIQFSALRKAKHPSQSRMLWPYADPAAVARWVGEYEELARQESEKRKNEQEIKREARERWRQRISQEAEAKKTAEQHGAEREAARKLAYQEEQRAVQWERERNQKRAKEEEKERYCINCHFCQWSNGLKPHEWLCRRARSYLTCWDARGTASHCGQEGRWFEPRINR